MSKHIPRIYCKEALSPGSRLRLGDPAAHHLLHVLRLKPGAALTLFDGRGGEYDGRLDATGKHGVEVLAGEHLNVQRESTLKIVLGQAISRGERMDYTLQKAVELGTQSIQPLTTERSQSLNDATRQEKKHRHWQDVVRSAAEQSGREQMPEVRPIMSLAQWLQDPMTGLSKLLLDPTARIGLGALSSSNNISLLSGPEGGLSHTELQLATQAGFTGIRLGPRILRTETAAVACLAAIQTLWGDLGN